MGAGAGEVVLGGGAGGAGSMESADQSGACRRLVRTPPGRRRRRGRVVAGSRFTQHLLPQRRHLAMRAPRDGRLRILCLRRAPDRFHLPPADQRLEAALRDVAASPLSLARTNCRRPTLARRRSTRGIPERPADRRSRSSPKFGRLTASSAFRPARLWQWRSLRGRRSRPPLCDSRRRAEQPRRLTPILGLAGRRAAALDAVALSSRRRTLPCRWRRRSPPRAALSPRVHEHDKGHASTRQADIRVVVVFSRSLRDDHHRRRRRRSRRGQRSSRRSRRSTETICRDDDYRDRGARRADGAGGGVGRLSVRLDGAGADPDELPPGELRLSPTFPRGYPHGGATPRFALGTSCSLTSCRPPARARSSVRPRRRRRWRAARPPLSSRR